MAFLLLKPNPLQAHRGLERLVSGSKALSPVAQRLLDQPHFLGWRRDALATLPLEEAI